MIKIEITADSGWEVRQELKALLGALDTPVFIDVDGVVSKYELGDVPTEGAPAETPVAEAAPKRTRGRPKKEEIGTENPTASAAGAVEADISTASPTEQSSAVTATTSTNSEPLTKEKTKERLMDLVQKIGSPQALAYMNDKTGFAKFGDMPAEKYAEFVAAIDAKLAEG